MRRPRTVVGRQTDCNPRVPAVDVSRRHCEIAIDGDEVRVRDLGSRNGTFVNGQRVDSAALSAGDILTIGPLVFVAKLDGEPAEIDAAAAYERGAAADDSSKAGSPSEKAPETSGGGVDHSDEPTRVGAAQAGERGGLMEEVGLSGDPDGSSVIEFDFDFGDDDDDQPPL
jgi:pSer/pThr/pTyr-binding forkhead associated (FHA) protein